MMWTDYGRHIGQDFAGWTCRRTRISADCAGRSVELRICVPMQKMNI
jgi:hypothetical protein